MGAALTKVDRENPPKLAYGTAGFRCDATRLVIAMERVGMLAALRSRDRDGLKIGVMVTASHNPHKDNGVKIVDPTGAMLAQAWESKAEKVACCPESKLLEVLASVAEGEAAGDEDDGLGREAGRAAQRTSCAPSELRRELRGAPSSSSCTSSSRRAGGTRHTWSSSTVPCSTTPSCGGRATRARRG